VQPKENVSFGVTLAKTKDQGLCLGPIKGHRPLKSIVFDRYAEGASIVIGCQRAQPFGGFSKGKALGQARKRFSDIPWRAIQPDILLLRRDKTAPRQRSS
jgi:hypothetical protein